MKSIHRLTALGACALLLGASVAGQAQDRDRDQGRAQNRAQPRAAPQGRPAQRFQPGRQGPRAAPFRPAPPRVTQHAWRAPGWAGRQQDMRFDGRFNHGYYYPRFGARVNVLPGGYRQYYWHGSPFFFAGGVWYSPGPGGVYLVARPPIGLFVPVLPEFYTTVWFGGVPYYYADDTYYLWQPSASGYVIAQPPAGEEAVTAPPPGADVDADAPAPTPTEDFYIYPKNGQSEQQQATDRYQCYVWAKGQTGFDPTEAGGGVPPGQATSARADYRRAMTACLTARGYSVQ